MATATYVSANSFTVVGDRTDEFVQGRRVRLDCQGDGIKYACVLSSIYSSPNTTITIDESTLTSNLSDVLYGVVAPGLIGSLPKHSHSAAEGDGGYLSPASGTTFIGHADTPLSYEVGKYLRTTNNAVEFTTTLSGTDIYGTSLQIDGNSTINGDETINGDATVTGTMKASVYDSLSPLRFRVNGQDVMSSASQSDGVTVSGALNTPQIISIDDTCKVRFTDTTTTSIGTILIAQQPSVTDYGAGFALSSTKFEFTDTLDGITEDEIYQGTSVSDFAYRVLNAINTNSETSTTVTGTITPDYPAPGYYLITVSAKTPGIEGNNITFVDNTYIDDTDAIIFDWDGSGSPPWSNNKGYLGASQLGESPGYIQVYANNSTNPIGGFSDYGISAERVYATDGTSASPAFTFLTNPSTGLFRDYLFGCVGLSFEGSHVVSFNSQGLLLAVDGTETQPSFNFAGTIKADGDTGIFKKGDDEFGFTAGGSEVIGVGLGYTRVPDDNYFMVGDTDSYGFGFLFDSAASENFILSNYPTRMYSVDSSNTIATFDHNSSVKLYYVGDQKIATTDYGVMVSGTIDAEGLAINGNATVTGTLTVEGDATVTGTIYAHEYDSYSPLIMKAGGTTVFTGNESTAVVDFTEMPTLSGVPINSEVDGRVRVVDGTKAEPSLSFDNGIDEGLYRAADNDIRMAIAGNDIFSTTASGFKLSTGQTISEFSSDGTLVGASDTVIPTERAIKTYIDDQINNVAVSGTVTISGTLNMLPNTVNVNPDSDVVVGKSYKTWADADTYVQSQSPSSTSLWTINIAGNNSENIMLRDYVTIKGNRSTRLTGTVGSSAIVYGPPTAVIEDCEIDDLSLTGGSTIRGYLRNCKINGGTSNAGSIMTANCHFRGGSFATANSTVMWASRLEGGVTFEALSNQWQVIGCSINYAVFKGDLWMSNCGCINLQLSGAGTYYLGNCWGYSTNQVVSSGMVVNEYSCHWVTCDRYTTGTGALNTYDCSISSGGRYYGDGWTNYSTGGVRYDHSFGGDHRYDGDLIKEEVGVSVVFGDLMYYDFSNSDYRKSSASSSATVPAVVMALETQTAASDCKMLVKGTIRDDSWNFSAGLVYASTISGSVTQTTVSGVGEQIQVVGRALTADTMFFDPQLTMEEVV